MQPDSAAVPELLRFDLQRWLNGRRFDLRAWLTSGDGKTPESTTQDRDPRALAGMNDGSVMLADDALQGPDWLHLNEDPNPMSDTELKTLAKLAKSGWKALANADQEDADELAKILKDLLEAIDRIEDEAAAAAEV